MERSKKQRYSSLLGLSFDGNRIEGVVLRRQNGGAEIASRIQASLTLDLLTNDPELVGQELRNALDVAEVRERRCVVCLPLSWALVVQTKLPDLPEEDVQSFLQIEAERGFPYAVDALVVATSFFAPTGGERYATQVAIPRDHVLRLDQALRTARLVPIGFSFGLTSLQSPDPNPANSILGLAVGDSTLGLQVTGGGGVVMLRSLDQPRDVEGVDAALSADVIARELRITLGHLPVDVRRGLRTLSVFGMGPRVDRLVSDLRVKAAPLGLTLEHVTKSSVDELGLKIAGEPEVSPALNLAAKWMSERAPALDFLPPRINAWNQFTSKYSSKSLLYAALVGGVVALGIAVAFIIQQVQLTQLRSQWVAIAPKVHELESLQQQIKRFRPWFDDSFHSLSILRRLTEVFPEDGALTAKTIEIRDATGVVCAGTARDSQILYKTLDQLRTSREVAEVQVDQLRGKAPIQFSFNFQWGDRNQP